MEGHLKLFLFFYIIFQWLGEFELCPPTIRGRFGQLRCIPDKLWFTSCIHLKYCIQPCIRGTHHRTSEHKGKMLGSFPKDFIPSGNFPTVQLLKRQLPKSVLDAALGPKPVLAVMHCVMGFYQKKI